MEPCPLVAGTTKSYPQNRRSTSYSFAFRDRFQTQQRIFLTNKHSLALRPLKHKQIVFLFFRRHAGSNGNRSANEYDSRTIDDIWHSKLNPEGDCMRFVGFSLSNF
jgi:hypothetical protein